MSEQSDKQAQDVVQLWRDWLTQTERQFNTFFSETMNTEAFARSMGGYMEVNAAFQKMMTDGMQRYLSFVNMPSRTDVISLGETLRDIEGRLARIEETLLIAVEASGAAERGPTAAGEPPRTKRPPGFPVAEEAGVEAQAIPEELRA
jgi:polyhydroxyalkanoic acid synthase PhaR subunit